MSDRICVYKTPLQRFTESVAILSLAAGAAVLWHARLPDISAAPALLIALLVSYLLVSRLGTRLAQWRGAALMTEDERNQRYLQEMLPFGAIRSSGFALARRNRNHRSIG
jgi:hypothetical protein